MHLRFFFFIFLPEQEEEDDEEKEGEEEEGQMRTGEELKVHFLPGGKFNGRLSFIHPVEINSFHCPHQRAIFFFFWSEGLSNNDGNVHINDTLEYIYM